MALRAGAKRTQPRSYTLKHVKMRLCCGVGTTGRLSITAGAVEQD
jgi:hypothetical protein